ncbi:MAG TPA: hypothetical protein DEF05_09480, partial [Erwinia sp.]|uniref:hypothetical protein n=1 Tax=Erwinia citreus TaxID=558 RepID=UPI000E8A8E6A
MLHQGRKKGEKAFLKKQEKKTGSKKSDQLAVLALSFTDDGVLYVTSSRAVERRRAGPGPVWRELGALS